MLTLSYEGTENRLKNWLAGLGIQGTCSDQPSGVKMLRCGKRLQTHWSSTTGSLWVSGKPEVRASMQTRLETALPNEDDGNPDYDMVE